MLGNGSNDVLELVAQAFLRPGDDAVYAQHAFAVYPLATQARGANGIEVPAKALGHDLDAMRAAITPRTRIVFVANPNNPTGTWLPPADVRAFVAVGAARRRRRARRGVQRVSRTEHRANATAWIAALPEPRRVAHRSPRRTAWPRCASATASRTPDVADLLNRVRQPFNVNSLAQAAALAALDDSAYVEESRALNREGMRQLEAGIAALGRRVQPSHGNFVIVHVGDGAKVYEALLRQGVIVRPVANYGLPEWLRVTVGLPGENARFLDALAGALGR